MGANFKNRRQHEVLKRDYRALYLACLKCAQALGDMGEDMDKMLEPPFPANLGKLTPSLRALIDFLELDEGLVNVADRKRLHASAPRTLKKNRPLL